MKILLWNIADLPSIINKQYNNDDFKMKRIFFLINQLNIDIACLQEVFSNSWRKEFLFGTFAQDIKETQFLNSGLMMIHRKQKKILNIPSLYYKYCSSMGEDQFSCKGLMICRRYSSVIGGDIIICNTHLQADSLFGFSEPQKIRKNQMNELSIYLTNSIKPSDKIVIVCGDFNHNIYKLKTIVKTPFKDWDFIKPNWNNSSKRPDQIFHNLDHVYAFVKKKSIKNNKKLFVKITNLPLQQCSDHNPLLVDVYID